MQDEREEGWCILNLLLGLLGVMSITGERTSLGIVLAVVLGGYTKSFFETGVDETDNIGRQLSQDDVVGHRVCR